MSRCALLAFALWASTASGQDPEWTTVPTAPPAATTPVPPAEKSAPAAPAEPAAAPAPAAAAPSPEPATAAAPGAPAPAAEEKVTLTPGSEPHSPGTIRNKYNDPANLRITSSVDGAAGLVRVHSADLGRPGLVHLSVTGEFNADQDFPVLSTPERPVRHARTAGTFSIAYTPLKFLQPYVTYASSAVTNSTCSPKLIQAQGDTTIGVVAGTRVAKGLFLGGHLGAQLFPGVGTQDPGKYAAGFVPQALATFDASAHAPKLPVRLHLNLGLELDSTENLVTDHTLSACEEFALGANAYDRFTLALALEAPLPYVTPFLEWGFAYPLGAEDSKGRCPGFYTGPDGLCVSAGQAMHHTFALGARMTAFKDVAVTVALELGFATRVARGIPATQRYNLVFGAQYNLDPLFKGESKLVERTLEKKVEVASLPPPPTTGKASGVVLDAQSKKPVPGALVSLDGGQLPPVATDVAAGRFLTYEVPPGQVVLTFAKDGYRTQTQKAVIEVGKVASLEVSLVREIKKAVVAIKTSSEKKPVAAALAFAGPANVSARTDALGRGTAELPAGHYGVAINADGFLAKARELEAAEGAQMVLDVELVRLPKRPLVKIVENKIQVKQQVHFATNKATILADSYLLLDQVIDAIIRANLKRTRVEGHTDNVGGKERNKKLSVERAQSVMDYLVKNGIDPKKVEADGFGDTRPVAPNLTARGRELNRRVEFVILER